MSTPITTSNGTAAPRLRLGLLLWLAGMLGAVVITVTVLPQLLAGTTPPAPLWVLSIASLAQSALLVGGATWAGATLAAKVGLRAPAFEAAASGRPIALSLTPQLLPGLVSGVLGGILLLAVGRYTPSHCEARYPFVIFRTDEHRDYHEEERRRRQASRGQGARRDGRRRRG